MWKNDPSEESSKGTNSQPLFSGAGVGASLSWFPSIGISVLFLYSVKIQSTRCARSMVSAIHKSTGHICGKGWKGTGQPTESGHGIMGGKLGKIYIQLRGESRQKFKLYKKVTHIEIELWWEATIERVREIVRPLIEFPRNMTGC